ncbi:MAG: hypothetical protein AAB368_06490, partial [bacterium]
MSRFYKGLGLALALASPALAVFDPTPKAARPQGMGGAFTGVADDVTAIHYNPAGLTRVNALQAHLFGTRLFGLKELQTALVDVAVPISKQAGTVGLSVEQFGDDTLLRERTITASHGIPLQEDFRFGYNLNLYDLKIGPAGDPTNDFGSDSAFGLDLGVMAHVKKVKKDLKRLKKKLRDTSSAEWTEAVRIDLLNDAHQAFAAWLASIPGSGRFLYQQTLTLAANATTIALSNCTKTFSVARDLYMVGESGRW